MDYVKGKFVGYKSFLSKAGKNCFVLSFILVDIDELNARADYYVVDIFLEQKIYNDFVTSHGLFDEIELKRELYKDKVRYYV